MIAWVAHELGTMPLFGVFTAEDVEMVYLFPIEAKPATHLLQMELLHLTDTIFFLYFCIIFLDLVDHWGSSFLLRNFVTLRMVRVLFKQMEGAFLHKQALEISPVRQHFYFLALSFFGYFYCFLYFRYVQIDGIIWVVRQVVIIDGFQRYAFTVTLLSFPWSVFLGLHSHLLHPSHLSYSWESFQNLLVEW